MLPKFKVGDWVYCISKEKEGRITQTRYEYVSVVFDCKDWNNYKNCYSQAIATRDIKLIKRTPKEAKNDYRKILR